VKYEVCCIGVLRVSFEWYMSLLIDTGFRARGGPVYALICRECLAECVREYVGLFNRCFVQVSFGWYESLWNV